MSDETNYLKHFEKMDGGLLPVAKGLNADSKRFEEAKNGENNDFIELLQNDDNRKLIEKYLSKAGLKEKVDTNPKSNTSSSELMSGNGGTYLSSTKEKVYQKILDQQTKTSDDMRNLTVSRGKKPSEASQANPVTNIKAKAALKTPDKISKYYNTIREKDGLTGKVSLKGIEDEDQFEGKTDLKALVKKKKTFNNNGNNSKKQNALSLTPKYSKPSFDQFTPRKYRQVGFTIEEECYETKLKTTIVHLRRVVDSQKHEIQRLDKQTSHHLNYISSLESILQDEVGGKDAQYILNTLSTNYNTNANTSKANANTTKEAQRNPTEIGMKNIDIETINKLNDLVSDSQAYYRFILETVNSLEDVSSVSKKRSKSPNKHSLSFKKKETFSDIPTFTNNHANGTELQTIVESLEGIIQTLKEKTADFSSKVEKTKGNIVSEPELSSIRETTKSKIEEYSSNKFTKAKTLEMKPSLKKSDGRDRKTKTVALTTKNSNNLSNLSTSNDGISFKRMKTTTPKRETRDKKLLTQQPKKFSNGMFNNKTSLESFGSEKLDVVDEQEVLPQNNGFKGRSDKTLKTLTPSQQKQVEFLRVGKRTNTAANINPSKISSIIKQISANRKSNPIPEEAFKAEYEEL